MRKKPGDDGMVSAAVQGTVYLLRFLILSMTAGDGAASAGTRGAIGAGGDGFVVGGAMTGTPMCRPYRPLRPLPSSSLMQSSAGMPASLHRPQGRCLSQPFLLFRQRWHRGFVERSGCSSSPGPDGSVGLEAIDCLREPGRDAGVMGPTTLAAFAFGLAGREDLTLGGGGG